MSASAEAVAVMMHDSDVLALWLARRGEVVDRFCNAPDYFGEPDPAMGGEGVPEAWAALLGSRAPSALQELWSRNKDDPEELLAEAVGIFGWDADRAESGHSHLGARPAGEDLVLEFCLTSPATWKRTSTRAPALHPDEVDLGELGVSGSALARRISQAATLQVPAELTVDAWNHGGAFTGVRLVGTWRPEELEISSVEMWTGGEGRPVPVRWSAHGEHPLVADVPLAVGAGPEDPMDVAESGYLEDMLEERGGAMVIARLHLVPKVRGRIEGTLSLAPPEGGRAAEYRFTLVVG